MREALARDFFEFVTPIMLAVIAFWMQRFVKKVDALGEIVEKLKETYAGMIGTCTERHNGINARLLMHDHELEQLKTKSGEHETKIAILENQIKD
ncbi:MAG: hypothetical protein NTU44_13500 [Bacteroidetes bacterium]|nr:hypothetical protein [Bacteroidota bacterium]